MEVEIVDNFGGEKLHLCQPLLYQTASILTSKPHNSKSRSIAWTSVDSSLISPS